MSDPARFGGPHTVRVRTVKLHGVGYPGRVDTRSGFRRERAAPSGDFKAPAPLQAFGAERKGG